MPRPGKTAGKASAYPDFIGIGAQKAGTTWLHHNLQAHPGIWMPPEKELHYFDEKIEAGGGLLSRIRGSRPIDKRWRRQLGGRIRRSPTWSSWRDAVWDLKYFFGRPNAEWYASLFKPGRDKVAGEATPDYSVLEKDKIAHVHELMPGARIIFIMRSPIERPWSAMDMRLRTRGKAMEQMRDRRLRRHFESERFRLRTGYSRTLENWSSYYPEDRIFVGFLEDVHFFPEQLLRKLYAFLDVDPSFVPPGARNKVHGGQHDAIPTRFAVHLAHTYHEETRVLHERFGGYASFWFYCAEKLINDPPSEEHIPYPLWESPLWEGWEGSQKVTLRSGPLSSLRTAS